MITMEEFIYRWGEYKICNKKSL